MCIQIGLAYCPILAPIYIELSGKIEFTCKLFDIVFVKVTLASIILPQFLITVVNYFIYDLKDESYFFSIPMM